MIRKTAIGLLTIIVMVLLTMAFGCKARKVTVAIKDSTGTTQQKTQSSVQQLTVDQSKIKAFVSVVKNDSTTTTTVITPADGEVITVNKDGTFTGKAKSISTTTKKSGHKKVDKEIQTDNNIKTDLKKDSVGTLKQTVTLHQKNKDVVATPSNGWIIYVAIGLLIIFVGVMLWKKFF